MLVLFIYITRHSIKRIILIIKQNTSFVRKVLRMSLQKIQNSTSQIMLPVPFEVVPSAVNTLLLEFLYALKVAGECRFRNAYELHCRSRLNSLESQVAVLLAFFSVVETEKNRTEREQGSTGDVEEQ
jgi:hypothetical protein